MYWHMLRTVNSTQEQRYRTSLANGVCQSFCQFCPFAGSSNPPCMPQMFFLVTPTDRNLLAVKKRKKALLSPRSSVQSLVCTQQMQKQVHLLVAPFATWTWRDWRVRLVWLGLYTQCWMEERESQLFMNSRKVCVSLTNTKPTELPLTSTGKPCQALKAGIDSSRKYDKKEQK